MDSSRSEPGSEPQPRHTKAPSVTLSSAEAGKPPSSGGDNGKNKLQLSRSRKKINYLE